MPLGLPALTPALDMLPNTLETLATSVLWLLALLRATTAPVRPICGSYPGLLFITTLLHIHRALKQHYKNTPNLFVYVDINARKRVLLAWRLGERRRSSNA